MVARKSKSALDSRKPGEGLSFTEKMIIIADYEGDGLRQCQLVKKYGLSKSFVCRIIVRESFLNLHSTLEKEFSCQLPSCINY
jgi:hypothetical protein